MNLFYFMKYIAKVNLFGYLITFTIYQKKYNSYQMISMAELLLLCSCRAASFYRV
jgi:hypothetical protein